MAPTPVRYRSADEDSARWIGFPYRPGDIVISARSKSGTTWVQMICALLIFGTADLPAPLTQLSPWLDWLGAPRGEVLDRLAGQPHRRFVKTHTPLDGIPLDPRATYLVVGRHPLDSAISLYHQGTNLDRVRMRELTGATEPSSPPGPRPAARDWLLAWIEHDADPRADLDSLPGVLWHLSDAWACREAPNVVLLHYDDLRTDLAGSMRRLAVRLEQAVPERSWPVLVDAAGFAAMRARAEVLAPDSGGVLKSRAAFFRRGRSGSGAELLSGSELLRYQRRAAALAPAELLAWLHR